MNRQGKNNLQVVLEAEVELKKWYSLLIQHLRKKSYVLNMNGDERIEFNIKGKVEVVNLSYGLEQIKRDLISLKEKYPL